jgi:hypothetical protein
MIFTRTLNTTCLNEGERSKTFVMASIARELPGKLEYIRNLYGNQLMKDLMGG